jgi:dTDP-glucose 4,6-dehydratase
VLVLSIFTKSDYLLHEKTNTRHGRSGLLGSHLCDCFLKEGFSAVAMDNLITGDLKNMEHLFQLKELEFFHHDVNNYVYVAGELDYILHFASPSSPIDYLKIPIQTLKVG